MQSVQYWTSACIAASSLHDCLIWRSCSSGRNFAHAVSMFLHIRLLSDSILRWTPLPSANDSYCQVRSGLSPPSYHPCRAHYDKRQRTIDVTLPFSCYPRGISTTSAICTRHVSICCESSRTRRSVISSFFSFSSIWSICSLTCFETLVMRACI